MMADMVTVVLVVLVVVVVVVCYLHRGIEWFIHLTWRGGVAGDRWGGQVKRAAGSESEWVSGGVVVRRVVEEQGGVVPQPSTVFTDNN
ncbi:hypothetical protein E2C01_014020 [Portunus trituberculatus]|uniref:Uncharacterized protein n=1 Tax=Portunus trituberculatus TaxID=210409 RepID=A0A5B7DIM4_PORTR|nr:hypothetical protein [Portunus trituberculatus]